MTLLSRTQVKTEQQVEAMRHIYNDNLDMLSTKPLPRRDYQGQQDWWRENNKSLTAFLYECTDRKDHPIAFLLLRNRGGFVTPIIAIKKEEWGKGFGTELIKEYIILANGPLAGTQLVSNKSICHLNKKLGWLVLGSRLETFGQIELLFHPGESPKKLTEKTLQGIAQYLELPFSEICSRLVTCNS
jgi:hypothetical protein